MNLCEYQFSVTVGTIFHRTHIGLRKFKLSARAVVLVIGLLLLAGVSLSGDPNNKWKDGSGANANDIYYDTGRVAIGTAAPTTKAQLTLLGMPERLRINSLTAEASITLRPISRKTWNFGAIDDVPGFYIYEDSAAAIRMVVKEGGNVGIGTQNPQSLLQVASNYIQFPTTTGSAPPATDCNKASQAGRVIVRTDGTTNLYVCTGTGEWVGK